MLAFLDTEFTDLVIQPRLLSVGLVAEQGSERVFYAEVTDRDRIQATNWFGLSAVLPQFGKIAHAACTYSELGARLATFLGELVHSLPNGQFGESSEHVERAFGYHLDWELIDLAIKGCGSRSWQSTRRRIRPVNVYGLTGFGAGKLASEGYFNAQAQAPLSRHHAPSDAHALRVAYEAAMGMPARPNTAASSPAGPNQQVATE